MDYFVCIVAIALFWGINWLIYKMLPAQQTVRMFFAYYIMQTVVLLTIIILNPESVVWNEKYYYELILKDYTLILCFGYLVIGIATLFSVVLWRAFFYLPSPYHSFTERAEAGDYLTDEFLGLIGIFKILSFISGADGFIFYFFRISENLGEAAAFIAGIRFRKNGLFLKSLWLLLLVLATFKALFGGGRTDLLPVILFGLGFYFSSPNVYQKRILLVVALALIPPVIVVSNMLSIIRLFGGRAGDLKSIDLDRIKTMLDYAQRFDISDTKSPIHTLERFFNQPNAAVLALTPSEIPYRGFSNIFEEINDNFSITGLKGAKAIENVRDSWEVQDFGLGTANLYGFYAGISSGVEFSILADGWSRAGPLGVFLYTVLTVLLLLACEWLVLKRFGFVSADSIFLCAYLNYIALGVFYVYPFFFALKYMILRLIYYFIVTRSYLLFRRVISKIRYQ